MRVPLVLAHMGLTQVVPTWSPRQIAPYHLRPSQKPTKAYKDLSGFFLGLKRGPNGQLYASPVLVHMGLSVF